MFHMLNDLSNRINNLEIILQSKNHTENNMLDQLYLASDTIIYRYLYLVRYIKENDRVLDWECQYGVGADLLSKYTAIDNCLCLNSIDYYTKLGSMYYQSDYVKFQTGCFEDLTQKFNIICLFNEEKNNYLDKKCLLKIIDLLEFDGILAIAWNSESEIASSLLQNIDQYNLCLEAKLYQNNGTGELVDRHIGNSKLITYFRKNG